MTTAIGERYDPKEWGTMGVSPSLEEFTRRCIALLNEEILRFGMDRNVDCSYRINWESTILVRVSATSHDSANGLGGLLRWVETSVLQRAEIPLLELYTLRQFQRESVRVFKGLAAEIADTLPDVAMRMLAFVASEEERRD